METGRPDHRPSQDQAGCVSPSAKGEEPMAKWRKASLTAGWARQSSVRRSVACSGAQRTDAPYPLSLTGYNSARHPLVSALCAWALEPTVVRLQKFLAEAGVASRRASEEIILAGRVAVNGETVCELGTKLDPKRDRVSLDGRPIRAKRKIYLALNKP